MYFFALSHAPPPEVMEIATKIPVTIVPTSDANGYCSANSIVFAVLGIPTGSTIQYNPDLSILVQGTPANGGGQINEPPQVILGHEMAHALREHARSRIAKSQGTSAALSIGAQLLGLGQLGDLAAGLGTQLLTLKFSRGDETDADLVGLEIAARGGYNPQASVSLWEKMGQANGGSRSGPSFLSTHPSGPQRIQELQANVPKVQGLYKRARG